MTIHKQLQKELDAFTYLNLTNKEITELTGLKEYRLKHNRRSKYLSLSPKKIFKIKYVGEI